VSYNYNMSQSLPINATIPVNSLSHASKCASVQGGNTFSSVNSPVTLEPLNTGAVSSVPVVIAKLTVQVNIDSIIDLPEPAIEIKRIKKHVKVTQCLLLQDTNILFIKGFIRKNIEFATRKCSNRSGICGDIRHCTVDVPFSCTTPISYNGVAPLAPVQRTSTEFEYFRQQNIAGPEIADKDRLLSSDLSEFNQISTEHFNQLPFCELVSARIVEFDEKLNPRVPYGVNMPVGESEFKSIQEKAVLFLTLKILQKRDVAVGGIVSPFPPKPCF
jgi:hypothetical protein